MARRESIFSGRCVTEDHGRPRRVQGVFTVPHVAPRCGHGVRREHTVARREHTVVHRDRTVKLAVARRVLAVSSP